MQKLLPPILFLISIAAMIVLHFTMPVAVLIKEPLSFIGLVPLVAGLAISGWHNRLFHRLGTNIYTFDEPGRFPKKGLFRYSRNPMYLGFVLALTGVFILLGSLAPLTVGFLFTLVTDRWYIAFEERAMEGKFGEEYLAYRQAVRRWI